MKYILPIAISLSAAVQLQAAELSWTGAGSKVVEVVPPASTGLDRVFVARSLQGLKPTYSGGTPANVRWYRYSNLGGGYAEQLSDVSVIDGTSQLNSVEPDMGYIIEDGDQRYCFWVVDYSRHEFSAASLNVSGERDCMNALLDFAGEGGEIAYFSINGRRMVLDREIKQSYRTLEANAENNDFIEKNAEEMFASVTARILVPAPLCSTDFRIEGDRFLREWGLEAEAVSPVVEPYAVAALTSAVQTNESAENEVSSGSGADLGGSGPCVVDFSAAVSDAAIFREWQFSRLNDFDVIDLRISDLNMTHTFSEEGTTYVRFVCANSEGACEQTSETYAVNIGSSSLRCPNAFSPGNGDGVNDEWKRELFEHNHFRVSYFRPQRTEDNLSKPSLAGLGRKV